MMICEKSRNFGSFLFFYHKMDFLGIMYNEGIIREEVCIVTKRKNRLKQFILFFYHFNDI